MARVALGATKDELLLRNTPADMPMVVGHAAIARTRRLLEGILTLLQADLNDLVGVLVRALFESWLVGVYALLGGAEAMEQLVAEQDWQLTRILSAIGQSREDDGSGIRPNVKELATSVTRLMTERGMPNAEFASGTYDVLYRLESYRGVHGGLGSLEGYVEPREDRLAAIKAHRSEDDKTLRHLTFVAVTIFVSGAQLAAIELGRDHRELDQVADRVYEFDPAKRGT